MKKQSIKNQYYCVKCGYNTNRLFYIKRHIYGRKTNCYNINKIKITKLLKDFGKEDLAHLSSFFIKRCIMNYAKGFADLFEKIHFSNEKSNYNIHKSIYDGHINIFFDNKWLIYKEDYIYDELIDRYRLFLLDYYIINNIQKYDKNKQYYSFIHTIKIFEDNNSIIKKLFKNILNRYST